MILYFFQYGKCDCARIDALENVIVLVDNPRRNVEFIIIIIIIIIIKNK